MPGLRTSSRRGGLRCLCAAAWLATGAAGAAGPPTTVFKCSQNGRVSFQQAPCAAQPAASALVVPPINTVESPRPASSPPAAPRPSDASPPAAPSEPGPAASALELESQLCLEHLKGFLRDPRSAYVSEPSRRGRVLSLTLHAANLRGGIVTRPAACEIYNGRVDPRWTRTHLERLGWFQDRPLLQGPGAKLEALRLDLDEIERPPKELSDRP